MIISDNAKTFKVASKLLLKLFQSPEVQAFLTKKRIVWKFILESHPGWEASMKGWWDS